MIPLVLFVLKLAGFFLIGVITWSLALYRFFAMERRRVNLLCSLVFVEELSVLFMGVWLANHNDYVGAMAIAAGGMVAAGFIMKKAKSVNGNTV